MENNTTTRISKHDIKSIKQQIKKKLKPPLADALSTLLTMIKHDFNVTKDLNTKLQTAEVLNQIREFVTKP